MTGSSAMFGADERDDVRAALLARARADGAITGAAITGSHAARGGDRWSDIDLALAVRGPVGPALHRWTDAVYHDHAAVHHWALPSGPAIYRVFLLPGWLEADLAFVPEEQFGPLGPDWRTVFGRAVDLPRPAGPDPRELAGRAWHHALQARISIERGRLWQAEYWLGALRGQVIALACTRLGYPAAYAKGAHRLPPEVTGPLEASLAGSLDPAGLRAALAASAAALAAELGRTDQDLAGRLNPMLLALTAGS
ncbi:MAG: hypothetical protein ACR2FU_08670 [Streptosporangiaceae bacterium]